MTTMTTMQFKSIDRNGLIILNFKLQSSEPNDGNWVVVTVNGSYDKKNW